MPKVKLKVNFKLLYGPKLFEFEDKRKKSKLEYVYLFNCSFSLNCEYYNMGNFMMPDYYKESFFIVKQKMCTAFSKCLTKNKIQKDERKKLIVKFKKEINKKIKIIKVYSL